MHLTRCQPCCALGFKPCNHVFIWMNRFQSDGLTALRCDIWKWSDTNSAPFSGPGPEWVFQSYLKAWIIFPSYIWPHFGLKWVKFSLNNKEKNKANKKKHVFVMPFFIYPFCQNLWFIFISMSAWSTLMFAYIYICIWGSKHWSVCPSCVQAVLVRGDMETADVPSCVDCSLLAIFEDSSAPEVRSTEDAVVIYLHEWM